MRPPLPGTSAPWTFVVDHVSRAENSIREPFPARFMLSTVDRIAALCYFV